MNLTECFDGMKLIAYHIVGDKNESPHEICLMFYSI
jgi:hypothetical protein